MLSNITVLYIEDDKEISEEVVFFLSSKLKQIDVAYDGEEGLEKFKNSKPNIIITDIQMPKLNGLDMIEQIRKEDRDIPIIIVSAFNETEKLLKAIDLKVDGYLTKPINMKDLLSRIEKLTKSTILQKEINEIRYKQAKESALKYQRLLELSAKKQEMAFWELDVKKEVFLFNDLSYAFLSTSIEREKSYTMSLEKYCENFLLPGGKERIEKILEEAGKKSTEHTHTFELQLRRRDSIIIDVSVTAYFIYDKEGNLDKSYGIAINLGKLRAQQRKLEKYINLIDQYIATSSTDITGKITSVSEAFCKLSGYSEEELIGKTHKILRDKNTPDSFYQYLWSTISENKIFNGEVRNIKKNGIPFWIKLQIFPLYNDYGIKIGYMEIEQDVSDKKRIEELSITDMLTNLYNRRYFNKILPKEINRIRREKKEFAFVMIDVDHFKLYNDLYGHPAGDKALVAIADVLRKFTNRAGDYAFRMGGEEFALILAFDDNAKLQEHLSNLLTSIEKLKIPHKNSIVSDFLTISAGITYVTYDTNQNSENIYKLADTALYHAKENGRNQIVYTTDIINNSFITKSAEHNISVQNESL